MRILRGSILTGLTVVVLLVPSAVRAQDTTPSPPPGPPAHLSAVDGNATIERDNNSEPAGVGMLLVVGDRITTTAGRAEILFPDGSALALDDFTSLDLQDETLVRVLSGRVLFQVAGTRDPQRVVHYQIDTPVATAVNTTAGEFKITLLAGTAGQEMELAVLRGTSSFSNELGSTLVRAGQRILARENEPPFTPQTFNSARFDEFDRWAQARRADRLGPAVAAEYLPSDLRMYSGTFDRYGDWQYEPSYGYVWYPTVATTWRPYYNGYWHSYPSYGWTWVGLDVWAWPTHHYGRWGYARSRWFWVPGASWGPSWVAWASAPGYVSWCPLGFDNRPVFGLSVNFGNPWAGWAVLPRQHFGVHTGYAKYYPASYRNYPAVGTFVAHASPPVPVPGVTGRAVPRPGSVAGSAGRGSAGRVGGLPAGTVSGPPAGRVGGAPGGMAVQRPGTSSSVQIGNSPGPADGARAASRTGTSFTSSSSLTTIPSGARAVPRTPAADPIPAPEPVTASPDSVRTFRMGGNELSGRRNPSSAAPENPAAPTSSPAVPRSSSWRPLTQAPSQRQSSQPADDRMLSGARSRSADRPAPPPPSGSTSLSGGSTAIQRPTLSAPRGASAPPAPTAPAPASPPPSGYRLSPRGGGTAPPASTQPAASGESQGRAQPRAGAGAPASGGNSPSSSGSSGSGGASSSGGAAPPAGARSRSR